MTRSEFVDQVADRAGLSKKGCRETPWTRSWRPSRARSSAAATSSSPASRQVQRLEPPGRLARHGTRRPARRSRSPPRAFPGFTAGAALKKAAGQHTADAHPGGGNLATRRRRGRQEQVAVPMAVAGARRHFRGPARRPASPQRGSQLVLGLRSRPRPLVAAGAPARRRAGAECAHPDARAAHGGGRPLCAGHRRRRRALRRRQAPARLLRGGSERPGWPSLRAVVSRRRATRGVCWSSPTGSAATSTSPRPPTGRRSSGETPTAVRPGAGTGEPTP